LLVLQDYDGKRTIKKLIMFSAISIISLSSFGSKETRTNKKPVRMMQYWWHCKNGSASGSTICDCSQSQATEMASFFCN
jgi:hypothetical protein